MTTTHIFIDRGEDELEVVIEYTYYPGMKAPHLPGDRYPVGPDDEAEVEIMSATVNGIEIELTPEEEKKAKTAAFENAVENADPGDEEDARRDYAADAAHERSF